MKFVAMIHSHPQPWQHPTGAAVAELQALPEEHRQRLNEEFDVLLDEIIASGELVGGAELGDPADAAVFRHEDAGRSGGPFSDAPLQLAGYFVLEVADRERAEGIARRMAGPGEAVELRPVWVPPSGSDGVAS